MEKNYKEITPDELSRFAEQKYGIPIRDANAEQLYFSISSLIVSRLSESLKKWRESSRGEKTVYYLSMEFLTGKNLKYDALSMGLTESIVNSLSAAGAKYSLDDIALVEKDPGLGNGGLGRLAACYMNSLSTLNYPALGYSICYERGFFTQSIIDGEQIERPDDWLKTGKVWLIPGNDETLEVVMGGKIKESWQKSGLKITTECGETIKAVPYDLPIPGYNSNTVNPIRLWKAVKEERHSDDGCFIKDADEEWGSADISSVLYPSDELIEGKLLRLSQQYFLVSASIQDIIRRHIGTYGSLERFGEVTCIHINDTHPSLAIPELMRIFMDEYGYSWDFAWDTVGNVFSYTNHTVMPEALETWNVELFRLRLPRIYSIILEINERVCSVFFDIFNGDFERVARMAPISYSRVRMASLCVSSAGSVNGVSKIHSEILKRNVFSDFAECFPEKFHSVTNGVSHMRWLSLCNPSLSMLIKKVIGDSFEREPCELRRLLNVKDETAFLESLQRVKRSNKNRFSDICTGVSDSRPDPDGVFDVQIKRFHEYKRQLMNALKILYYYRKIKEGSYRDYPQLTFIFGGKTASGYKIAKTVLKLIWNVGVMISSDQSVKNKIIVLFAEDYGVSSAETIIPSADISEQISLAGKEASGTGCMKMMMNGALTLGTPDGANLEIRDAVGDENAYIFGMGSIEAENALCEGYHSMKYYIESERVKKAVDTLDYLPDCSVSEEIKKYLLFFGDTPDPYMCLRDFDSYIIAWERAVKDVMNGMAYASKSVVNIAESGFFSSDRAVKEYAEKIWRIKKT